MFTELLTNFGLPTALLIAVLTYHVRAIRMKDKEIRRVNESRLTEQRASSERMMQIAKEFTRLSGEQEKTLSALTNRLDLISVKRNR